MEGVDAASPPYIRWQSHYPAWSMTLRQSFERGNALPILKWWVEEFRTGSDSDRVKHSTGFATLLTLDLRLS